jgi:hypothetical protein
MPRKRKPDARDERIAELERMLADKSIELDRRIRMYGEIIAMKDLTIADLRQQLLATGFDLVLAEIREEMAVRELKELRE